MAGKGKVGAVLITFDVDQKAQVENLAKFLTQDQMAEYFGICRKTFYSIMERDPEVEQCFNRGRAHCHAAVARSLVQQALDGNVPAQVFYLKTRAGWKEDATAVAITGTIKHEIGADAAFAELASLLGGAFTATPGSDSEADSMAQDGQT